MGCGCGKRRRPAKSTASAIPRASRFPKPKPIVQKEEPKKPVDIKASIANNYVIPTPVELHQVFENPLDPALVIETTDQVDPSSGANHRYRIFYKSPTSPGIKVHAINFQKGPVKEVGVNGVTQEALLSIVKHRLESFQEGPFSSKYNEEALKYTNMALEALNARTIERIERKVEGLNKK